MVHDLVRQSVNVRALRDAQQSARGNFNRPHFHPYDREIYVVSGTWWVGTGTNQDPAISVAMRPGTYVKHLANQVHWDGTKDEDVLLMIGGEGPEIEYFVR
jgi:quercetin dioxygenase-like cupin family protein